ncbi:hypothetical protein [Cellulosimicrobium sp. CUA-896]|uniref:hypothetical protein n=1 Tax=Cellulosimicrobium sp. CUA-896 TaxID=1517881 RepID=UPI0009674E34|nr:hypothetical protein [Cellulosimicrobium sp. CUA-896]OLT51703.1 hypothetical protein BJF88_14790 [Cellulosimicrobium sp. CUA-896]
MAALAAAFVASSLWQSWSDRAALLGSAGGVSSLATAPAPAWEADASGSVLWAVGDVLVVARGDALAGLAQDDGTLVWTTPLGGPARCAAPGDDAFPGARAGGRTCSCA